MGLVPQAVLDEWCVGDVAPAADRTGPRVEGDPGVGLRHARPSSRRSPGFVSQISESSARALSVVDTPWGVWVCPRGQCRQGHVEIEVLAGQLAAAI